MTNEKLTAAKVERFEGKVWRYTFSNHSGAISDVQAIEYLEREYGHNRTQARVILEFARECDGYPVNLEAYAS